MHKCWIYWVPQKLPQIYTVIASVYIGKLVWFTVYICDNKLNAHYIPWLPSQRQPGERGDRFCRNRWFRSWTYWSLLRGCGVGWPAEGSRLNGQQLCRPLQVPLLRLTFFHLYTCHAQVSWENEHYVISWLFITFYKYILLQYSCTQWQPQGGRCKKDHKWRNKASKIGNKTSIMGA